MVKIFILVGTNPIPCYISALYLLRYYHSDRELYLVCSTDDPQIKQAGTCPVGKLIMNQILVSYPDLGIYLKEISDVASNEAIARALKGCYADSDDIHLNYTGGTKSMAAIAYNILKDHPDFSSSYLDGRRHIMIMDGMPDSGDDLRQKDYLKLDMEKVISLHGKDGFKEKPIDTKFNRLLDEIVNLLKARNIDTIYCRKNPQKNTLDKLKEEEEKVRQARDDLKIKSGIWSSKNKEKDINKFIDGLWLEQYLRNELNSVEHKGVDIYFDVEKNNDCQLDLIAIYGYQMTLISVTTDANRPMCKLKAFEAIHRASQLGGDEAKTIMVTFMPEPQTLEETIGASFGSLVPGFKAFGINDFYDETIINDILKYIEEKE